MPVLSAPASAADMRTHGHGQGYARATDAREVVRTYLREHPDAIAMSSRDLAAQLGVGKTIVAEELKAIRMAQTGSVVQAAEQIIREVRDEPEI